MARIGPAALAAMMLTMAVPATAGLVAEQPAGAEQCVSADLRAAVRGYSLEWRNGLAHVLRWRKVRRAFDGQPAGMTAATARRMAERYSASRWDPVVEALDCLEAPTWRIAAGADVTEGGKTTFTLRADRGAPAELALPVTVSGGAAVGIADATHAVAIRPGATVGYLTLESLDDAVDEPDAELAARLTRPTDARWRLGSPSTATVRVLDDDAAPMPVATLHSSGELTEGETARLTLRLDRASASDMTVRVTVGGAAWFGVQRRTHPVTIPAGATAATLDVPTVDDSEDERHSSIVASITRYPADPFETGSPRIASALVRDDDEPAPEPEPAPTPEVEVSLVYPDRDWHPKHSGNVVDEHSWSPAPFSFGIEARDAGGRTDMHLEFRICVSGTATLGVDYEIPRVYDIATGDDLDAHHAPAFEFAAGADGLCTVAPVQSGVGALWIRVLPDGHDDDGETVTLRLVPTGRTWTYPANVRPGQAGWPGLLMHAWDAGYGPSRWHDPWADTTTPESYHRSWRFAGPLTFTIANDGPLPREYLADLGHSIASSAVDAVTARLDAPRDAGVTGALGSLPGAGETLGLGDALPGSWLSGTVGGPDGRTLGAWARVGAGEFESGGQDHVLAGVDYASGPWLAGVGVLHAESDGASRGYDLDGALTAAVPYGAWRGGRLALWGAAGLGSGDVAVLGEHAPRMEAATDWRMLALGGRYRLGERIAATADGFHQRLESDDSPGMRGARGETHRVRAGIEGALAAGPLRLTPAVRLRVDGGDVPAEESIEAGTGAALDLGRLTLAGDFAATLGGAQWSRRSGSVRYSHRWGTATVASGGAVAFSRGPWRAELADDSVSARWRAEF